eukprot:Skav203126  [mRNA]  locus=scaffold3040:49685:51112:+ [translate_table: standard]
MDDSCTKTTFFTDGGALHPCDVGARIAAFAVIQDTSPFSDTFIHDSSQAFVPQFQVVTSGFVQGSQTAARGELTAFLRALQAASQLQSHIQIDFVTDAKYICDLIQNLLDPSTPMIDVETSNVDLIEQIQPLWQHPRFQLRKVKSHRTVDSAKDRADLYDILGNMFADKAVTSVLQFAHKDITYMSNRIAAFHDQEKIRLTEVATFLIDLNKSRLKKLDQEKCPPPLTREVRQHEGMASKIMGPEALTFMIAYAPSDHVQFASDEIPDLEYFQACQQGAKLGMAVVFWLQTLKWPPDVPKSGDSTDWGISWIELFFDFHVSTAMTFPIRIEGLKKQAKYVPLDHPDVALLPSQKKSPAYQAFCLQKMISTIETISGLKFMPHFKSHKCSSLNRLGLQGKTAGVPRRPTLRYPEPTMLAVSNYFRYTDGKLVQSHAFDHFDGVPTVDIPDVTDLRTDERCRLYQRLMKRASRARTA